jgi:N-acetylglucosaminyldiphosphoundecaprenol N-acetyl-beta-D-mannosaminyltransferase
MINILGIPIYDDNLKNAVATIVQISQIKDENDTAPKCISATGSHGLVIAQKDKIYSDILKKYFWNLPDGIPSVWIGKLKGAKNMERCYGPDLFREVMIASKDKDIKHYFCGGKDGVAEDLKKVCEEKFNNHNIIGVFTPPFRKMADEELIDLADKLTANKVDIIWLGMSTPKQEMLAFRLSKYTKVSFICTVGAAFDFHTGRVIQAPKLMQKSGFEWLFRLITEPRRLWKRYFEVVPMFIYYNIKEYINFKFIIRKNLEQNHNN